MADKSCEFKIDRGTRDGALVACDEKAVAFVSYHVHDAFIREGVLLCDACLRDFTEMANHRLTAHHGLTIYPASRASLVRKVSI